jgi:hypothetical protein
MTIPAKYDQRLPNRCCFNHSFKDHFKRHGVAAAPTRLEKVAVAGPLSVIVRNGMRIIGSVKRYRETAKVNAVPFFSVAFRLLDLTDHTRIHGEAAPFKRVVVAKRHAS